MIGFRNNLALAAIAGAALVVLPVASQPLQGQARAQDQMVTMSGAPHFVAAFVTAGRGFTTPEGGVPMQHIEDWSRRQGVAPSNNPRPTFRTWGPIGPRDLRAFSDKIAVPFYNIGGWYDIFEK